MRLFRRRADEAEAPAAPAQPAQWERNPRVGPDPVIDVTVPTTNPELDAAVNRWLADVDDVEARKVMKLALARAVYLVPVGFPGSEHAGERLPYTDRTTFGFLRIPMPGLDGAEAIGVCTNEDALSRTAPNGSTILVMRAVDLYVLALQRADYPGLLINPGDGQNALPLYRPWCEEIRYLLGKGAHPIPEFGGDA